MYLIGSKILPYNYYLFLILFIFLHYQQFNSGEPIFFSDGTNLLLKQWQKIVDYDSVHFTEGKLWVNG